MNTLSKAHLKAFGSCFLHEIPPFDWDSGLLAASRVGEDILRRLAGDKSLMRALLEHAIKDPYLWSKCEEDLVEDKIVLWDDVDRDLRIRLRMSTAPQQRLAHSHRFSFTNLVLRGTYIHWVYQTLDTFDERTRMADVKEVMLHEDTAGDCFTIHHDTLHSTPFTEEHTISLVLRGNPVKERAPVMFKESRQREEFEKHPAHTRGSEIEPEVAEAGDMFWRVGEDRESEGRRMERRMSKARHAFWLKQLTEYGIL